MSEWKARRFWKQAQAVEAESGGGWAVALDGRRIKTPAKTALVMPSRAMAEAVAAEWDAQGEQIDPRSMPVTRAANSALDKVSVQFDEVAGLIADYADSDLLCYRADGPEALTLRQAEAWDPLLDWADTTFGVRLQPVTGVMHRPQQVSSVSALRAVVFAHDPFSLTALSDLVALSGSLVIGLASTRNYTDPGSLYDLSRLDELWQEEQWGRDEEAHATAVKKRAEFVAAKEFFDLAGAGKQ